MNRALVIGVCSVAVLMESCSPDTSPSEKLAAQLNQGALEMLNGHASEKIVIYHPETANPYVLRLEKHFPCSSTPCDAPSGQAQGLLKLTLATESLGHMERWVSVPQMFEVSRKGQDTAIILQNKDWYAEVRAVY
jgi:hypothetical protein